MAFIHWSTRRDDDGIVWATLDCANASVNTLTRAVLEEFSSLLDGLQAAPPAGLVILSGKPAGFIAGADLHELGALDSADAARAVLDRGWKVFERLAGCRFPTLALIRGHCMGGGLELALACRYRVAIDEPGTRLSLPEVRVGLVPAWGGMLRLPRLIGPMAALDMMLTARAIDARRGKRMGLVDECVPARVMVNATRAVFQGGRAHRASLLQRVLNGPGRPVVAWLARRSLRARASREHYPAPYALIEAWARHGGNLLEVPASSPHSLASLIHHPTGRNLLRVFFLQERLKSIGRAGEARAMRVHVIGAGTMGGDIAACCVLAGMTVSLQDQDMARIAQAITRAATMFSRRHARDPLAVRDALDRLIADSAGQGAGSADVVIEAIVENLDAKRALFADIEPRLKPDAVLATNTSSLRLEDIAAGLRDPSRLVGIHFFNPVAKMPLVEVVRGENTDAQMAQRAADFVRAIDKLPLPVKSAPGFLVNAVLAPYLAEAMRCVDEGIAPEVVDRAALEFGMPMGPIELVDTVGLDVSLAAGRALVGGDAPRMLQEKVAASCLGRKTGEGFYRWRDGRVQKGAAPVPPAGLAQRLILPLLLAAQRCLDEGVVEDADLVDAGVIFGTGFAPFTGGPLRYAGRGLLGG